MKQSTRQFTLTIVGMSLVTAMFFGALQTCEVVNSMPDEPHWCGQLCGDRGVSTYDSGECHCK